MTTNLSFNEIDKLYKGMPNDNAKTILPILILNHLIHNDSLYILNNETISYDRYDKAIKIKETLLTTISEIIENSYNKLTEENKQILEHKYKTTFKSIFQPKNIENYLPALTKRITNNNINFDLTLKEIHFKNGYIDLTDNTFKQRIIGTHFITTFINRDYHKSTEEQQQKILKIIKEIYPLDVNRNCILRVFGSALTGLSQLDQTYLFLLGRGSSGKSTILQLTEASFEMYLCKLKNDALVQGNQKADKIFNTFDKAPYIRIIWINEPQDKRMDAETFKQLVEGQIETTKLYAEGSYSQTHHGKVISTMNNMLNIKIDSGTVRRTQRAARHASRIVESLRLITHSANIFIYPFQVSVRSEAEHFTLFYI
jgi:hypothetical protein